MIYVHQPQLPITYAQLYFGTYLTPSAVEDIKPCNSAVRLLTQRQLQRGTKRVSRSDFIREVESLGTELQLTHRGYAHSVGAVVLSRTLPKLMKLLLEALTEPRFDPDEVEQSKRAYIAELEARYDDDHSLAWLWLSRRLHILHPLWNDYSVERRDIENIQIQDLQEAWNQVFSPAVLLPCFTSNLKQAEVDELLHPLVEALGQSASPIDWKANRLPNLPPIKHNTLTLVNKPGKQQASIFIAHPTLSPIHPQSLALYVALCALGGTFSSPLMQEVRTKRGLSYGASAGIRGESHCRFVCLHTTPEAKQAAETLKVMLDVYTQAVRGQLSDQDLAFAKSYLINAHPFTIETPAMRAALAAHSQLMDLPPEWVLEQPKRIEPLSFEEIRQAAQDHLSLSKLEIVIFGDQDSSMPNLENELKEFISIQKTIRVNAKDSAHILHTYT